MVKVNPDSSGAIHKGGGEQYSKRPFRTPGPRMGREIEEKIPDGWHQLTNLPQFLKWQYKGTPYRVIVDFEKQRGHWRALFTSTFGDPGYLIQGNCGGGESGMMKAVVAANRFMQKNENGCPPPNEYE